MILIFDFKFDSKTNENNFLWGVKSHSKKRMASFDTLKTNEKDRPCGLSFSLDWNIET